jgi:glutamate racemase
MGKEIYQDRLMPSAQKNTGHTIGVFDSGLGGVCVCSEIKKILPLSRIIYIADQKNIPYGDKPLKDIKRYTEKISQKLITMGADIIVIACNTASAASLYYLREKFPEINFVGMEPAVKPAAIESKNKKIGIIATTGTFNGEPFAKVVAAYAKGVEVFPQPCPGLVELIEEGEENSSLLKEKITSYITPLLDKGVDKIVLGCTHYSLIKSIIEKLSLSKADIIDPAPAIARQTKRILSTIQKEKTPAGEDIFLTTNQDKAKEFSTFASRIMQKKLNAECIELD